MKDYKQTYVDIKYKDTDGLKVNGWKNIYYANCHHKKAGMALLISNNIDFKTKYTTKQGTFHNDERVDSSGRHYNKKCVCIYKGASKYMMQKYIQIKKSKF